MSTNPLTEAETGSNAEDDGTASKGNIRPANAADYNAAARLFTFMMGEHFTLDKNLWDAVCDSDDYTVLVAEAGKQAIVGIAVLVVSDRIRLSAGTRRTRFHLDQLIVDPSERQKGYAHALLEEAKRIAASKAPSYIIVNCDFTNVAARRTYESADLNLVRQAHDRFEIAFTKKNQTDV